MVCFPYTRSLISRPPNRHGRRVAIRGSEKGRSNPEQGGKEEEWSSLSERSCCHAAPRLAACRMSLDRQFSQDYFNCLMTEGNDRPAGRYPTPSQPGCFMLPDLESHVRRKLACVVRGPGVPATWVKAWGVKCL